MDEREHEKSLIDSLFSMEQVIVQFPGHSLTLISEVLIPKQMRSTGIKQWKQFDYRNFMVKNLIFSLDKLLFLSIFTCVKKSPKIFSSINL